MLSYSQAVVICYYLAFGLFVFGLGNGIEYIGWALLAAASGFVLQKENESILSKEFKEEMEQRERAEKFQKENQAAREREIQARIDQAIYEDRRERGATEQSEKEN